MRIGVIGCKTLVVADAASFAKQYVAKLVLRYERLTLVTVKEDCLGQEIRKVCRKLGIRTRTVSTVSDQSTGRELAIGRVMWMCKNLVVLDDDTLGLNSMAVETVNRMRMHKMRVIKIKG